MEIGCLLKEERLRNKLSQEEVAKAIGSTKQAVYKYENGIVTNIPLDKIEIMARLFGVTPAYLMGWGEDEKTSPNQLELTEGERVLIEVYRRASDEVKPVLINAVKAIESMSAEKARFVEELLGKRQIR